MGAALERESHELPYKRDILEEIRDRRVFHWSNRREDRDKKVTIRAKTRIEFKNERRDYKDVEGTVGADNRTSAFASDAT